jgi:hypothetical protein
MLSKKILYFLIALLIPVTFICIGPISQPLSYHDFADKRLLLGIPYALNVLSSLTFLLAGLYGVMQTYNAFKNSLLDKLTYMFYMLFFIFIMLVTLGSIYYHLDPNNTTLFWDRLLVSIAETSLGGGLILERSGNYKAGLAISLSLIIFGIFSVIYWGYSEQLGSGDLRLYGITQVLPALIALAVIMKYPQKKLDKYLIYGIFLLIIARITEVNDHLFFNISYNLLSGHTLKHLLSAVIVFIVARYIKQKGIKRYNNSFITKF